MTKKILGLSGCATVGKDLFANLLICKLNKKGIIAKRFALADCLKDEVRQFSLENYGIDPLNCSAKEKEIIRPFLITHGCIKRDQTNGEYWLNKIEKNIDSNSDLDIAIISDIRFKNEGEWVKDNGGKIILIKRWLINNKKKVYVKPAHITEKESLRDIRKLGVDYTITWGTNIIKANEIVDNFLRKAVF